MILPHDDCARLGTPAPLPARPGILFFEENAAATFLLRFHA